MKKAVVLGMILLALGVMAYADGVTVGLDFGRTQFNVVASDGVSGDPMTQGWVGPTAQFPTGQRLDMQFAWSNDKVGINITDYVTNGGSTADTIVNAYGTLKFVPDMFTAYIGEFNGDGWDHFRLDTAHPIHDVNNNNVGRFGGWGAILDVMPKDTGFELAMFAKLNDPGSVPSQTVNEALSQYDVAASYMVPNTVKIAVGSTTFAQAPSSERNVFFSAQLFMVPNLTIWDNFYYAGFDARPDKVSIYSDLLGLSYDMKPVTLILAAFFGQNNMGSSASVKTGAVSFGIGNPDYAVKNAYLSSDGKTLYFPVNGGKDYTAWALQPEVIYNMGAMSLGLYATVGGFLTKIDGTELGYTIEPYVKLNDFGVRISFLYNKDNVKADKATWEVPILIDWGF
jgi:hypothetical protein